MIINLLAFVLCIMIKLANMSVPMCNMLKVLHHNQLIPIECHLTFNGEEGVNTSTKIYCRVATCTSIMFVFSSV